MDTSWSHGYVADIDYTYGYYRELAPSLIAFSLLLAGYRFPWGRPGLNYLELGCGQGLTTAAIAASMPESSFWAIDINPTHVAGARRRAEAGGLANATYLELSFEELLETQTPSFDVVSLHGVYSWVSPENRRRIVDVVRRKLAPGGVVYVSYNALPGWDGMQGMRELLVEHARTGSAPTASRVDQALAFVERVRDAGAGYFAKGTRARAQLDRLKGMPKQYLAHEYFNADWHPQYFAEVARELSAAKLGYAGSANPGDFVDGVNLGPQAAQLLKEIPDPLLKETVREYFLNRSFRRDLFVRGAERLGGQERGTLLEAQRFVLAVERQEVSMKPRMPVGQVTLNEAVYGPLLDVLERGVCSLADLLAAPETRHLQLAQLVQAMAVLCSTGAVEPALPEAGVEERRRSCAAFNSAVLSQALRDGSVRVLSSPVAGSGRNLGRVELLVLSALTAGAAEPHRFVQEALARNGERVVKNGEPLTDPAAVADYLGAEVTRVREHRLPVYRRLGLV